MALAPLRTAKTIETRGWRAVVEVSIPVLAGPIVSLSSNSGTRSLLNPIDCVRSLLLCRLHLQSPGTAEVDKLYYIASGVGKKNGRLHFKPSISTIISNNPVTACRPRCDGVSG